MGDVWQMSWQVALWKHPSALPLPLKVPWAVLTAHDLPTVVRAVRRSVVEGPVRDGGGGPTREVSRLS